MSPGQAPPMGEAGASMAEWVHRPRGCGQGRGPSDALRPWAPWVIRKVKSREVWGSNERAKPGCVCVADRGRGGLWGDRSRDQEMQDPGGALKRNPRS